MSACGVSSASQVYAMFPRVMSVFFTVSFAPPGAAAKVWSATTRHSSIVCRAVKWWVPDWST